MTLWFLLVGFVSGYPGQCLPWTSGTKWYVDDSPHLNWFDLPSLNFRVVSARMSECPEELPKFMRLNAYPNQTREQARWVKTVKNHNCDCKSFMVETVGWVIGRPMNLIAIDWVTCRSSLVEGLMFSQAITS